MFQKVVVSLACVFLLVAFNVGVSDAIVCYYCQSDHDGYCGTDSFDSSSTISHVECPEKKGREAVCVSRTLYFPSGARLYRGCQYHNPGERACGPATHCWECKEHLCNNVTRLPWMTQTWR